MAKWILIALIGSLSAGWAAEGEKRVEGVLDPKAIRHEQGFCYTVDLDVPGKPDTAAGRASYLRLFEDEEELGPPHVLHQVIRDTGRGAFSHWSGSPDGKGAMLFFSTSDNSDPRTNGRTYKWALVTDRNGKPVPSQFGLLKSTPCRLRAVPTQALTRDRNTTLLAHFDAADNNDATYARVHRAEVGLGSKADAPGRFDGGVSVEGTTGAVQFPGLDNYNPLVGTVEFWAQSRAEKPIWSDGIEHWLLILYPERAGAGSRYGMTPHFLALRKTAENTLELKLVTQSMAPYAAAVGLRQATSPALSVPADKLAPNDWHHIAFSWDLRGSGRLWLLVDGTGVTADLKLKPDRPAPNPGGTIVLGGFWGLPGDDVRTSDCNLDELRVQDCTIASRLVGARPVPNRGIDEARLLSEIDLSRAMLDKLMELQYRGGWAPGYQWPTYTPTGWSRIGRGVDFWFAHGAGAAGALLRGWMLWGDDRYLDAAIEAADMICKTQMENGAWAYHYSYSRGEFVPWSTHAYIAQAMQSNQIRFLCLMYRKLGTERYGQAIRKAGDWMVSIQFPNGAWGWEAYPLGHKGPYGHPALNDAITPQAMWDLFVIWCATGERKYLDCVLKGAEWIRAVQAGAPTFGWADQYDEQGNFIWMRDFEPPAVSMQAIHAATWGLCLAYDLTGDDKYLEPLRKVLQWMDTVPEEQRGWLWYDPEKNVPVVAYYNEMLPVTDPKAIKEIIPRLDAHYGTKFPWQADHIRQQLKLRENGPIYQDRQGPRPRAEFAKGGPTANEEAERFRRDLAKVAREQLAAWAEGKPKSGILGGSHEYGRTFEIGNAVSYCETLLSNIESALVALGDLPPERLPRYARGGIWNWTYMEPERDYFATPLAAQKPGG